MNRLPTQFLCLRRRFHFPLLLLASCFVLCTSAGLLVAQQPAAVPDPSPAANVLDPYQAARVPIVTLATVQPTGTLNGTSKLNRRLAKLAAAANSSTTQTPAQPPVVASHGRIFDEVNLGYLDGGKAPAPMAVSLQFDATRAGATVWVQAMDGGAILTTNADGQLVSTKGGNALTINALGQVVFSFQALARPGRYQLLMRLDSVSSVLPFVILDPREDN